MIMSTMLTIVIGGLFGFVTSARTPTDGLEDLIRNVVVGMAGAFVGLQVASSLFDSADAGSSAIAQTLSAITGAAIFLVVVNRVRNA